MLGSRARRAAAIAVASVAAIAAAWQRVHALRLLPPDHDELVYVPIGYRTLEALEAGRPGEIARMTENFEHPPMGKLACGLAVRAAGAHEPRWDALEVGKPLPPEAGPAFQAARAPSAAAGSLQVALLAAVSPLAGLLLALDPYHAKYTAQAMLEGIPGLFALLAAVLLERALRREGRRRLLLALLAAAALGAASAGKYAYGVVLAPVLAAFVIAGFPRRRAVWVAWAAALGASFLALAPNLWADPIGGVAAAVRFHVAYSFGEHVTEMGLPWWAPLYALTHAMPVAWHPGVFAGGAVVLVLPPLAAIGMVRAWRTRPVWAAWACFGVAFLLVWNTKWAQYLLLVLPALAVCAAEAPAVLASAARRLWARWGGEVAEKP